MTVPLVYLARSSPHLTDLLVLKTLKWLQKRLLVRNLKPTLISFNRYRDEETTAPKQKHRFPAKVTFS